MSMGGPDVKDKFAYLFIRTSHCSQCKPIGRPVVRGFKRPYVLLPIVFLRVLCVSSDSRVAGRTGGEILVSV